MLRKENPISDMPWSEKTTLDTLLKRQCMNNSIKLEHIETLLGAIVACGRHGGMGYGTGLCGLYVDGAYINKKTNGKSNSESIT